MTTTDRWCAAFCGLWLIAWTQAADGFAPAWRLLSAHDAPAWVQAIGSIIAILAAVWVANDSARRNRQIALEMRNRDAAARIEIALHIADEARGLIGLAEQSIRGTLPLTLGPDDFQSVRDALDTLPFAELSSGRLVTELMAVRRHVRQIEKLCETHNLVGLAMNEPDRTALIGSLDSRVAHFNSSLSKLHRAVRDALDKLNRSHEEPPPA